MNDVQDIWAHERGPPSEEVKQNRAQTVYVGGGGKLGGRAFGLLGRDVARCSKCLQRSRESAIFIEPFRQSKVAHHRLAASIQEDVYRLKIAMQNSLGVRDKSLPCRRGQFPPGFRNDQGAIPCRSPSLLQGRFRMLGGTPRLRLQAPRAGDS